MLAFAGESADEKAVLAAVLETYKRDGKFKFVEPSADLRSKFAVNDGASAFVVYNARKARFAKTDALTEQAAKTLIDRVVGGDVKWTNL